MSDRWSFFDKHVRRHMESGLSDDEALVASLRQHREAGVPDYWYEPDEARLRLPAIRASARPPRSDEEAWALLDEALVRHGWAVDRLPAPTIPDDAPAGPTLAEIERARLRLASEGQAHGYDSLGGPYGVWRNARSTIQRRYRGRQPPGAFIPGCVTRSRHTRTPANEHPIPVDANTPAPGKVRGCERSTFLSPACYHARLASLSPRPSPQPALAADRRHRTARDGATWWQL